MSDFSINLINASLELHPIRNITLRRWISAVLGDIDSKEDIFFEDFPPSRLAIISISLLVNRKLFIVLRFR